MSDALWSWALVLLIAFGGYKMFGWWFFGFFAVFSAALGIFGPGIWLMWLGVGFIGFILFFGMIGSWNAESDRLDANRYLAKKLREEEGR
jgi:hypothetical protein